MFSKEISLNPMNQVICFPTPPHPALLLPPTFKKGIKKKGENG